MDINIRIFELLKEKNKTAKDLGEYIGVKPSSISAWKNEGSYPSSKYIVRISEFLQVSIEYLLTGVLKEKSSSTELTADEQELLTYYKKLPYNQKERALGRLEALSEVCTSMQDIPGIIQMSAAPSDEIEPVYIEIYNLPASAGTGVYLDNCDKDMLAVHSTPLTEEANFALEVRGDSMEPRFHDGDYVLIRTQPSVDIGEIGIFILNDEGYIKKFEGDRLISLNPEYDDIFIREYDDFCCKGKVLGVLPEEDILD